ncbi:MAG TPA: TonB-dependent receptor [Algoriphagus sp.]|jgi:outer membrane receptor for ferrienterochelin and colicins|uniref:TonB-dependent receptor n=2 Tax=Algoriphagus TaxID=246875 RepID=UPI000EB83998|nr:MULTISPECIES: TonB-dependent receptor [unclassified Algoriphagus]QYH38840.1 TonB-dependent receptor [Algoriphagus sp. NBT04N3]HCD87146.1 TonB-dependent receptor [Algoriphagus sp.]|tara:strand:- start:1574 stop:3850 length:2277 start_codon:yes stop_codon:yes gene_type:complete
MITRLLLTLSFCYLLNDTAQGQHSLKGRVLSGGKAVEFATIFLPDSGKGAVSEADGHFQIFGLQKGRLKVEVSLLGFRRYITEVEIPYEGDMIVEMESLDSSLDEVVVSGTLQEVSRLNSPVPVEVYKEGFFKANPTPSLFESLQNINGVRPQINCNICNTGDIHINGLEGPYTMVLIDGMPIVSGLSTVYGLTGIPQSLIDRIEVVKGPASTLYGSEAVGGLINIITKNPDLAPKVGIDAFGTGWGEYNLDLGIRSKWGRSVKSLTGINAFYYDNPIDNNGDGMTDLTLAKRISVFQKMTVDRASKKALNLGLRYLYEDRWGGQMNWTSANRGGDEIYGESIYTSRWEVFGNYELPGSEKLNFQFSANGHNQNSVYGDVIYIADQTIAFGQLTWAENLGNHQLLSGLAYRYTKYDDNTPATSSVELDLNQPSIIHLPGVFVQDEIKLTTSQSLLLGARADYNSIHGAIFSPRLNYKISSADQTMVFRLSAGNGFRVANVFTEDHAALTGAREVVFEEELQPERSWNVNANAIKKYYSSKGAFLSLDASLFYTYFTNRIIPDYETNPNQIIYANLDGHAVSKGVSLNSNFAMPSGLEGSVGATLMDVTFTEEGISTRQLLSERFSTVWNIGYTIYPLDLKIDYTGNLYSPMRLPLLGELDDRPEFSPWWSIQNIQLTKSIGKKWEVYGGVKNLLNFTPPANSIARAFDPFDRGVEFGSDGSVIPTPNNPNALTFDPTYMFAPNQGIRGFLGLRFTILD